MCLTVVDKLYAVGGCDGSASLDTVEVFDPILGEWRVGPSMNMPRSNVGVAVLKNRLYAVGGFSGRDRETVNLKTRKRVSISSRSVMMKVGFLKEEMCLK